MKEACTVFACLLVALPALFAVRKPRLWGGKGRMASARHNGWMVAASFAYTLGLMVLLLLIRRFAPFGDGSLAYMDANIQYLDFLSYLKDVLHGENNLFYTFSKTLGGSSIAIFAYYLASPFNLLVLLFPQTELHSFVDLVIVIKIGLCGASFSYFLLKRFPGRWHEGFILALSTSYALMQFTIAQASNIMWLENVAMLPLLLLGVHQVVRGRGMFRLSLVVGLSLLLNWYTAAINCIFACFWLALEVLLQLEEGPLPWKHTARAILQFGGSMLVGALLSGALLLPAALSMLGGRGEQMDALPDLLSFSERPLDIFNRLVLGSQSILGSVSLYCGTFALVCCTAFFTTRRASAGQRLLLAGFFVLVSLFYTSRAFQRLFSLFMIPHGFWYRYSYVGIFAILFVAAKFLHGFQPGRAQASSILRGGALFCGALLLVDQSSGMHEEMLVYATVLLAGAGMALLLLLSTARPRNKAWFPWGFWQW